MRKRLIPTLGLALAVATAAATAATASAASHANNWQTHSSTVVCGITQVHGTALDAGTMAEETGLWPGLQCSAEGLPPGHDGGGDPFVQLGQGQAGRAKLVYVGDDDLTYSSAFVKLPAKTTWSKDGITCAVKTASVSCHNSSGHGFTLSKGHLKLH